MSRAAVKNGSKRGGSGFRILIACLSSVLVIALAFLVIAITISDARKDMLETIPAPVSPVAALPKPTPSPRSLSTPSHKPTPTPAEQATPSPATTQRIQATNSPSTAPQSAPTTTFRPKRNAAGHGSNARARTAPENTEVPTEKPGNHYRSPLPEISNHPLPDPSNPQIYEDLEATPDDADPQLRVKTKKKRR